MRNKARIRAVLAKCPPLRKAYRLASIRRLTYTIRRLPDFIIIGAQKSGTTTLYDCITDHPLIAAAATKEVSFFSSAWHLGVPWYKSQFPVRYGAKHGTITGEATPAYMFNHAAPERMHAILPNVKLICILRNPVNRAYSQWRMNLQNEAIPPETTFEQALDVESAAWANRPDRMYGPTDPDHMYFNSYLAQGEYATQLERWFRYYPREQFLFLASKDLLACRARTLNRTFEFLGLPPHETTRPNINVSTYSGPMKQDTRRRLAEHFRPHNARLRRLIDITLD